MAASIVEGSCDILARLRAALGQKERGACGKIERNDTPLIGK
jgi:hypothetical protein